MGAERWQHAIVERGKPRVYIQQFLDLRLPEPEYLSLVKELGLEKPFEEEAASRVMEMYLEELNDGSQFDHVHLQQGDGLVVLVTVISYPYKQDTYDRLLAEHIAKKALGTT